MKETSSPSSLPLPGDILVAHPDMPENVFARTLVYLHSFSEDGAMGFILNRPLGQSLGQIASDKPMPKSLQDIPLFFGGPVHSDHFILTRFIPDDGVHTFRCQMNPDPEEMRHPPEGSADTLRASMGFAGWSAGQLEDEIRRGDWRWVPSDEALLRDRTGTSSWNILSSGDRRWQLLRPFMPKETGLN